MKKSEFDLHGPDTMKLSWLLSNGQTVLLSCCNQEKTINGIMTLSWMTPTSHDPLLFTVSVGNGDKEANEQSYRFCYSLINETKEFGINIPTPELTEAVLKVGTTHSNEIDKFADTGLTPFPSTKIAAPLIEECFMNIECSVLVEFITGDHTVFVAKPLAVWMNEDVMVNGIFSEKFHGKIHQVHLCDLITLWNMW